MTATADFVVVGGGIAGASAAYELAAVGSVVLVEQEATHGHHTTGRSAALYTESYESGTVRKLVMAFYSNAFRVGQFIREHPQHGGNLTNLLIGRIFQPDIGRIFEDLDPWLERAAAQEASATSA